MNTLLKFTLRKKLLFFFIILSLIPMAVAGKFMIRITQDELKSFLNDELIVTADQIAREIDSVYIHTWLAPLLMMKRVVENDKLGSSEKMAVLTTIGDVADIVLLQVSIEGASSPILIMQNSFTSFLKAASLDPYAVLSLTPEQIETLKAQKQKKNDPSAAEDVFTGVPTYIPEIDSWLISIVIPLKDMGGRKATLSARVSLERIKKQITAHPFNKSGNIMLVYREKEKVFKLFGQHPSHFHADTDDSAGSESASVWDQDVNLKDYGVVQTAKNLLDAGIRTIVVEPYDTPSGEKMIAGYAFPFTFDWLVIVEKNASKAYLAVTKMMQSLMLLALVGLIIAIACAVVFSNHISRPILEIGNVVKKVGKGEFDIRVRPLKSKDEISELGRRINEMIEELSERFQLLKFVSCQTMQAIKTSKDGVQLGGRRITATVFFTDIRGFTSFSEKYEPEVVINMLNTYLRCQAEIVRKHNGDIDKYVGDALIAVFQGEDMVKNAILSAVEIHKKVEALNKEYPEWGDIYIGIGINTGVMIRGAMGSEERMDYTILGDNVNLGARLCAYAGPCETILSENTYRYIKKFNPFKKKNSTIRSDEWPEIVKDEEIRVKGKSKFIQVYKLGATNSKAAKRYPGRFLKWYN